MFLLYNIVIMSKTRARIWANKKFVFFLFLFFVAIIGLIVVFIVRYSGFGEIIFSHKNGFYDEDIIVKIDVADKIFGKRGSIQYNMNGDDLNDTYELYKNGIKLSKPDKGYELYSITARVCYKEGCSDRKVGTYVLGDDLKNDITIDVININSSQKNLYDYYTGIMVGGRTFDLNEQSASLDDWYVGGNYNNRGKKWMRDAYINMFDTSGGEIWDQDCFIEVSGGTSASYAVKSLKVTLPLQEQNKNGDFVTFRLRSGSQDQFTGNIRSSIVSRLVEQSRFDIGTTTKRVVVFLNGDYYGIFDMQQNFSDAYLMEKYGLEKKKYLKKARGSEKGVLGSLGVSEDLWENLNTAEARTSLEEKVDMDNYLKYYATQILINNTDWPMNNYEAWKYDGKKNDEYGKDGKVRFLLYDTDLVYYTEGNIEWFDGAIGDIFDYLMEGKYNGSDSTFRKVMDSDYYRDKFINLVESLLDGVYSSENVLMIVNEEAEKIEHQVRLFSNEDEYLKWMNDIELLKKAASEREGSLREKIKLLKR